MTDDIELMNVKMLNLETENRQLREEVARQALRAEVAINARAVGLHPTAVDDACARLLATGEWKKVKGQMVRHVGGNVADVLPNGQPANAINALKLMRNEAPFFYEDGVEDGVVLAAPTASVRTSVVANTTPKAPEKEINMTTLSLVAKTDPGRAREMMRQANWSEERIAKMLGEPEPVPAWAR